MELIARYQEAHESRQDWMMARFEFEGLAIDDAGDIVEAFRKGVGTRPRDQRPWAWIPRFAAQGVEARQLVAEAVEKLVAAEGGRDLEPTPVLHEVMNLAELAEVHSHVPMLRERLSRGFGGEADARVSRFLDWLVGARPARSPAPLGDEDVERIIELARRPDCFGAALPLVCEAAPWRVVELVVEAGLGAWQRDEPFLRRLALQWRKASFAPYRLELLRAAANASRELLAALRREIERLPGGEQYRSLLDIADGAGEQEATRAYAKMLARSFFEGGAEVRGALLLHPRDEQGLDAQAGCSPDHEDSLAAYAAIIQASAREFLEESGDPQPVSEVGEPAPLDPDADMEGLAVAMLVVPVSLRGSRTQEISVLRLRDRFKIALAVAHEA
jgi:hypothetical protein